MIDGPCGICSNIETFIQLYICLFFSMTHLDSLTVEGSCSTQVLLVPLLLCSLLCWTELKIFNDASNMCLDYVHFYQVRCFVETFSFAWIEFRHFLNLARSHVDSFRNNLHDFLLHLDESRFSPWTICLLVGAKLFLLVALCMAHSGKNHLLLC